MSCEGSCKSGSCRRRVAYAALAFTFGLVLYSVYFYMHLSGETPTDEDWAMAAKLVKSGVEPGDALAVVPFWATPGERKFIEQGLIPRYVRDVAGEEWPGAKRLWVVSGYDRFLDRARFLEKGANSLKREDLGRLQVELFTTPQDLTRAYQWRAHLSDMNVWMQKQGARQDCEPYNVQAKRFVCSRNEDWQHVGPQTAMLGDSPRPVIWAHPRTGVALHIEAPQVVATHELVVQTGFLVAAQTLPNGAPVTLEVRLDGKVLGRVVQTNRDGWFTKRFPLTGPSPHHVDFAITTPNDGRRHFVFDAFAY